MQYSDKSSNKVPSYSVVIPVYGSAGILPELYRRITAVMKSLGKDYEIIFVEDCGLDNAWQVLQKLAASDESVIAVQLMRNSGQSSATLCGLANSCGELVFTMDDDLQHPPEEIPKLLQTLNDDADVVMGVPVDKKHHWFRRFGSTLLQDINSYLVGNDRNLRFSSFRLMRRSVVNGLLELRTISPALGLMINSITHRIINVDVQHAPRNQGHSSYTLHRLVSLTMNNIIGYSMLPLRVLAILGVMGVILCVIFSAVLLVRYLMGGISVPGWTTIVLLQVLFSSFSFFAFAILGEYLLRILQRVNATPQYFIRSHISRKQLRDSHLISKPEKDS
jgi:dolichol-phosphate mannosyltransferase/undecaprenyl-phosphate 4-deoxy-4-formamido-L-arabinose transferase